MMTSSIRFVAHIAAIAALAGFSGCAKIRYPNYYVLNLPGPVAAVSQPRPLLGPAAVREFGAPEYLKSGPIVYRVSPGQLGFYDYHRWAVEPRSAVTAALISEIQAHKLFQSVSRHDGRGSPDYLLTGTLDRLEEVDRQSAVSIEVRLSAQLTDQRSGAVLWQDVSSINATVDEHSVSGIVAEMSRAVESAVARLAASLEARMTQGSASADRE